MMNGGSVIHRTDGNMTFKPVIATSYSITGRDRETIGSWTKGLFEV